MSHFDSGARVQVILSLRSPGFIGLNTIQYFNAEEITYKIRIKVLTILVTTYANLTLSAG